MASQQSSVPGISIFSNGFGDNNNLDKTGVCAQGHCSSSDGPGVNPLLHPNIPRIVGDWQTYPTRPNAGSSAFTYFSNVPGSRNGVNLGVIADANKPSGAYMQRATTIPDPVNVPYDCPGMKPPKKDQKDGVPINTPDVSTQYCYLNQDLNQGHYAGVNADDRNVPWDRKTDISTAETAFGAIPGLGMLRSLPGMIMSLASSFNGLSKNQKQAIKSNTSNQMYTMIESMFTYAVDVGQIERVSLGSRVHKEEFANNMVKLLCQCKTRQDVIDVMGELRSNTALHGKDKLPKVEFKVANHFGPATMIIDGHGEYTHNVSPQAANAAAQTVQFLTQGQDTIDVVCQFEGQITGNTLSVVHVDFGQLYKGSQYYIEGQDVTDNTYITLFSTGAKGNVGLYIVSEISNTEANTQMFLHKVTKNPAKPAGGGGGMGGLTGIMGTNMFGEASKLLGEILPVMNPKSAAKVQQVLATVQKDQILKTVAHQNIATKKIFAALGSVIPKQFMGYVSKFF